MERSLVLLILMLKLFSKFLRFSLVVMQFLETSRRPDSRPDVD